MTGATGDTEPAASTRGDSVRPLVAVVAHRMVIDTLLGPQPAALAYGGYLDQLERIGVAPVILAPGLPVADIVRERLAGLVLLGGGDVDPARFGGSGDDRDVDADRDDLEIGLVEHCRSRRVPVMAICRGCQVATVALGGRLHRVDGHVQDEPMSTPTHVVEVEGGSRLAGILDSSELTVNSFHRWAVAEPAPGTRAVAHAAEVIEAVESVDDGWFFIGVQWHAELLADPSTDALFDAFGGAVGTGAHSKHQDSVATRSR